MFRIQVIGDPAAPEPVTVPPGLIEPVNGEGPAIEVPAGTVSVIVTGVVLSA